MRIAAWCGLLLSLEALGCAAGSAGNETGTVGGPSVQGPGGATSGTTGTPGSTQGATGNPGSSSGGLGSSGTTPSGTSASGNVGSGGVGGVPMAGNTGGGSVLPSNPSSTPGTGTTGGAGSSAPMTTPVQGDGEPKLPTLLGSCPTMAANGTYQFGNSMSKRMMPVVIYIDPGAKSKPAPGGPLILYYHATGGTPSEVNNGFGATAIQQVTAAGGVVAAFTSTGCSGCTTTDDLMWFVEDDYIQDDVVACAVQQAKIDTHRIHALGWSAGALHSAHIGLARSNYMASIISYSGGAFPLPPQIQDPTNHVASIMSYGKMGVDAVVLDFHQSSVQWYNTYQPKGYYTMMCDHEGGHMIPPDLAPHAYQFFKDHPFEVNPEPYASGVPSGYPAYCKNMP